MFDKITKWIVEYFYLIFLLAIVLWLFLPKYFIWFYELLTPLIVILMYLWSLDIEYEKISSIKEYWKHIVVYYIVMMIILPVILYYTIYWVSASFAGGAFLLAIAPAGIAAVAFTRLMWGNTLLALLLAIITTISTPIILPVMSKYILWSTISIDSFSMFIDLVLYCILPIIAAFLTKRYIPKTTEPIYKHLDWVSILLIWAMIAWPVAYNSDIFLSINISKLLLTVIWLFILSLVIHIFWWYCFVGTNKENKIAWSLAKWFMNISLATVIAAKYFSPEILLVVILYEFPWDLMLIPFQKFIKNIK